MVNNSKNNTEIKLDALVNDFLSQLNDAEMILIGIGEEFDELKTLKQNPDYSESRHKLEKTDKEWLIPALNQQYQGKNSDVFHALSKFEEMLSAKNYFVVSVSTNENIRRVSWKEKRLVMPCGGTKMKQCANNCGYELSDTTEDDWAAIRTYTDRLLDENWLESELDLGVCPKCGSPLVFNSIYTEKYNENGYLGQWQVYTKWLQGTLNRRIVVLELGVGMQCPSVIRWPFEKIAYFNEKASFWRVNERLYQLSEELKEKGRSISMNAIDWLGLL